jgi:hypothetical protein
MAAQTAAPPPRTIEKGDQSNVESATQAVVQTDAEWTALWRRHAPDRPVPPVDFSRETVVGVFMGSRPTAGFSIEVLSTLNVKGAFIVRYRETLVPAGAVTAQVLTFPYHLVAVPKVAVTESKFEKVP